jgi:hypothetical protein
LDTRDAGSGFLRGFRQWWPVVGAAWLVLGAVVGGVWALGVVSNGIAARLNVVEARTQTLADSYGQMRRLLDDLTTRQYDGLNRQAISATDIGALQFHAHAIDARLDGLHDEAAQLHEALATQNERLLFLLGRPQAMPVRR